MSMEVLEINGIAFDLLQMYIKVFVSFCNNFFRFQGHAILYIQEVTKV